MALDPYYNLNFKFFFFSPQGLGTDEQVLIEIICSRSNQQLKDIKAAYKTSKLTNSGWMCVVSEANVLHCSEFWKYHGHILWEQFLGGRLPVFPMN